MSNLDIEVPFGTDGRFLCSVPSERVLLHHVAPRPLGQLSRRVRNRLISPLDFPALSQAVLADDRIVIALDQGTPCAPSLIRGCWDVLETVGVEPDAVVILQSGSPGPAQSKGRERAEKTVGASRQAARVRSGGPQPERSSVDPRSELPDPIAARIRLAHHDAEDARRRAYLASTASGERIYLARELVDADFVLCVGAIAYDPLLGYRGTSSALYPGLSSEEAIRKARGQGHDELGPDDLRALRQTIDEVGWLLGVQFALQVIPAGRNGVADVLAGSCDAVLRQGKQQLAEHWAIDLEERPETVVLAVDAVPKADAWAAVGAALDTARQLVARDGRIVVLSQADAPLSPGLEMIRDSRTPRDALQPLRLAVPHDITTATQIARAADWARVFLLSGMADDLVEDLFMTPVGDMGDCRRLLSAGGTLAFVESAPLSYVHRRVLV